VIYGIPRSTLRNKVYKLGKDRDKISAQGIRNTSISSSMPSKSKKGIATATSASSTADIENTIRSCSVIENGDRTHSNGIPSTITGATDGRGNDSCNGEGRKKSSYNVNSVDEMTFACENDLEKVAAAMISTAAAENGSDLSEDMSEEKKKLKEWLRSRMSRKRSVDTTESDNGQDEEGCNGIREPFGNGGDTVLDINRLPKEHHSVSSDNSSSEEVSTEQQDLHCKTNVILKIPSVLNNKSSLNKVISKKKLKRRPSEKHVLNHKFTEEHGASLYR